MGYRGSKSDITQSSSRLKKIIFFLMRSYFLKFFYLKKSEETLRGKIISVKEQRVYGC